MLALNSNDYIRNFRVYGVLVVISVVYPHFMEDMTGSPLLEVLMARPASFQYIEKPLSLIHLVPEQVQRSTREVLNVLFMNSLPSTFLYSSSAFNVYGDLVMHQFQDPLPGNDNFEIHLVPPQEGYPLKSIELLNSFAHHCAQSGAEVCFSFPPIPEYIIEDEYYSARINSIAMLLERNLNMPILGTPAGMSMDTQYFFDTAYHLTWEGAATRTKRLLILLDEEFDLCR